MWVQHMAALGAAHVGATGLVRRCAPRHPDETRWLLVHAVGNLYCAALAIHRLVAPPLRFDGRSFTDPLVFALLLHLYHVGCYALSRADLFHHAVFIPLLCVPGAVWDWGAASNVQLLFMNGIPGALLYTVVASARLLHTRWWWEPHVTLAVNALVRLPGILVAAHQLYRAIPPHVPWPFVWIQFAVAPANGVYYTAQAWQRVMRVIR